MAEGKALTVVIYTWVLKVLRQTSGNTRHFISFLIKPHMHQCRVLDVSLLNSSSKTPSLQAYKPSRFGLALPVRTDTVKKGLVLELMHFARLRIYHEEPRDSILGSKY